MNILNLSLEELRKIQPFLDDEQGLYYALTWVNLNSFVLPNGVTWHVDKENILFEVIRTFGQVEALTKHL